MKKVVVVKRSPRGAGACGGKRRLDGSGMGVGNRNTPRQPAPRKSRNT